MTWWQTDLDQSLDRQRASHKLTKHKPRTHSKQTSHWVHSDLKNVSESSPNIANSTRSDHGRKFKTNYTITSLHLRTDLNLMWNQPQRMRRRTSTYEFIRSATSPSQNIFGTNYARTHLRILYALTSNLHRTMFERRNTSKWQTNWQTNKLSNSLTY